MHHFSILNTQIFCSSFRLVAVLLLLQQNCCCWCYHYKVGDLNCWGLPPPSNPFFYFSWSQSHHFRPGDSLLFLYPPSQDSVVQVTERAFNTCSLEEPVLEMDDGNSFINLTTPGHYYFTSGVAGRCEKNQKLAVAVPSVNGTFFPPAAEFAVPPAGPPSYPIVLGPTPAQEPSSSRAAAVGASAAVGSVVVAALLHFWSSCFLFSFCC